MHVKAQVHTHILFKLGFQNAHMHSPTSPTHAYTDSVEHQIGAVWELPRTSFIPLGSCHSWCIIVCCEWCSVYLLMWGVSLQGFPLLPPQLLVLVSEVISMVHKYPMNEKNCSPPICTLTSTASNHTANHSTPRLTRTHKLQYFKERVSDLKCSDRIEQLIWPQYKPCVSVASLCTIHGLVPTSECSTLSGTITMACGRQ